MGIGDQLMEACCIGIVVSRDLGGGPLGSDVYGQLQTD